MSRDYNLYLDDIRQSCQQVIAYTAGMTREQFFASALTYDAVMHNLMIIGEAVKNIPQAVRDQHPQVEWQKAGRFRDHVVHQYFSLNSDIVWDVVRNKVPELLTSLAPPGTL